MPPKNDSSHSSTKKPGRGLVGAGVMVPADPLPKIKKGTTSGDQEMDVDNDESRSVSTLSASSGKVTPPPSKDSVASFAKDFPDSFHAGLVPTLTMEERVGMKMLDYYTYLKAVIVSAGAHAAANINEPSDVVTYNSDKRIYCFKGSNPPIEFVTKFYGELTSEINMDAHGNKPVGRRIGDDVNVRGVFNLKRPTNYPVKEFNRDDFFRDQIWFLDHLFKLGEGGPTNWADQVQRSEANDNFVMRWPASKSSDDRKTYDQLQVHTEMMYTVPRTARIEMNVERSPSKRKTSTVDSDDEDSTTVEKPEAPSPGALYEAKWMYGYHGDDFVQKKAKLVQLNICDIHGNLIFPWEYHHHLTPGTIVVIKAKFKKWVVPPTRLNKNTTLHLYQLIADSVRVLAKGEPLVPAVTKDGETFDANTVYLEDYDNDFPSTPKKPKMGPKGNADRYFTTQTMARGRSPRPLNYSQLPRSVVGPSSLASGSTGHVSGSEPVPGKAPTAWRRRGKNARSKAKLPTANKGPPTYRNPAQARRVQGYSRGLEFLALPVDFAVGSGMPIYRGIPADADLEIKVNKKKVPLAYNDVRRDDLNEDVIFPRAPPAISHELPIDFIEHELNHSKEKNTERWFERRVDPRLEHWKATAEVLQFPKVSLQALSARGPKEGLAAAEAACVRMASDSGVREISTSTIAKDEDGNLLFAYFALDPTVVDDLKTQGKADGTAFTMEEIDQRAREMDASHSPMTPEALSDFLVKTEWMMHHISPATKDNIDISSRHGPSMGADSGATGGQRMSRYMEYSLSQDMVETLDIMQEGVLGPGVQRPAYATTYREGLSTTHFVQAWHQNGHRYLKDMTASKEMLGDGSAKRKHIIDAYHLQTIRQREALRRVAQAAMPAEDFASYERTYAAGNAFSGKVPGPFLAQVTVHKCQSRCHRDQSDGKGRFCLTMPAGKYSGGRMFLPDLNIILSYRPGDILLFRSCDLYHFVEEWTPGEMDFGDFVTPGRTAFVFFTPAASARELDEKPEHWFVETGCGVFNQQVKYLTRRKKTKKGSGCCRNGLYDLSDGIRALLGHGAATSVGGELVLTKPYGALFLQRLGTLAPRTEQDETAPDRDWDDDAENWDVDPDEDAAPLHTLILLNTTLSPALIPLFPSTLTRIALVALIAPLPGLHRLPARTPLLVFIDLSFNPWLTDLVGGDVEDEAPTRMLDRIVWERWRRLEVVGLRECGFDQAAERDVAEKIQRGRIHDVQVYL
ncbi:hypothetical protein EXIGLDRAFT_764254 [Exidia glandulosa HHB12029]|uniref:Uncharacterized protein n=1 Tax=Exidia glandulosa HHB12029 TaxID=1314781 RepID=A0A165LAH9_EXIGL|nr:hypothetical protein EXIGLDRAFT_764254 [Exidia glandulosa HHB12029]